MMTVGNSARTQVMMAQVQTKYGNSLDSLYGAKLAKMYGSKSTKAATQSLEDLLKSDRLKNKDAYYREQFSNLYKSIYGISDDADSSDDSSVSSVQSIKTASASAGNAAQSMKTFADQLKYGGELDVDAYKAQAQSFIDSYNSMIDKVGNSDNQRILQKGVLMVNTGKVYSNSLRRAGITVGADNKLSLNSDLSKVKASDVKFIMGSNGFTDKLLQKAGQINSLAGGSGVFTANSSAVTKPSTDSSDKTDNSGTLKELTAAVKDLATEVKSYVYALGSDEEKKEFVPTDFTDTANKFIEKYNSFIDEMNNSDKASVRSRGQTMQSIARSYKYSLSRAGISVDQNGKLSMTKNVNDITEKDVRYAFGSSGGFLDKVTQKADQVKSLVTGASAMGYNADKTTTYAYNSGALYSVYA